MIKSTVLLLLAGALTAGTAVSQHCERTSVGLTPINDLGTQFYRGWQGGLYPQGENAMPAGHLAAGEALAAQIEPLNING